MSSHGDAHGQRQGCVHLKVVPTGCLSQKQSFDFVFGLPEFLFHLVNLLIPPGFTGLEIRFQFGSQVFHLHPP
ncbi:MAG: hypothetical protein TE42_03025 [Candidatus Synechococcus spongiarum SP3]|uniref:Uncharacterized protein n=1 Tax=Candidatus Synechococcus spongiarum SP3 TaxID=1604020 RepID=A0A0G2IWQ8_9SYNE|nr:MAG: hypothetical protein TE42_03025 [Candidatus Synechococcus spongiarum SP3]